MYQCHPVITMAVAAGEQGRRIRELTSVVQKRWKFPDGQVELFAEKVMDRGLCAVAQKLIVLGDLVAQERGLIIA